MIEPFEQIFKTFGFFGLFISALIFVIVTLYNRSERQHKENEERIKTLEAQRDKQVSEERELLLKALNDNKKVIEDNTRVMKRIIFLYRNLKNDDSEK